MDGLVLVAIIVVGYMIACFFNHCYWGKYTNPMDYIKLFFFHAYYSDQPIDFEFDRKLRQAILDKKSVSLSYAQIHLGGVKLWGCNFPYAYGSLYEDGRTKVCPTKSTAYMLRAYVKEQTGADGDLIDYFNKKDQIPDNV